MANSSAAKLLCVVVMAIVVAAPVRIHAITCAQVVTSIESCLSYVKSGGSVPAACCKGIKSLGSEADTTASRQAVCNCLKSFAGSIKGVKPSLAIGLPSKCGVSLPFKITTSINCSSVH